MTIYDLLGLIKNGNPPEKIQILDIDEQENDMFTWNGNYYVNEEGITLDQALDISWCLDKELRVIEDNKKIEDRARFQYSQIPNWFKGKELINTINANFERHQKAIYEIIDKLNEVLNDKD